MEWLTYLKSKLVTIEIQNLVPYGEGQVDFRYRAD